MKTKSQLPRLVTGAVVALTITQSSFAPVDTHEPRIEKEKTEKKRSTKRNRNLRIYPDVIKRSMHVIARDGNESTLEFFVFALDGTLMAHHRLEPGDHIQLEEMPRGMYTYEVFDGDEISEKGKLEMR